MPPTPLRIVLAAVLAVSLLVPAGTAAAAGTPADAASTLDGLSARLDAAVRRAERRVSAAWDPETAAAVQVAGLDRLERTLADVRLEAAAVVDGIAGAGGVGTVAASLTGALFRGDVDYLRSGDYLSVLGAWGRFEESVAAAREFRNALRVRIGLPPVTGLRVCPLASHDAFLDDWGAWRGWWRSHKGTDLNAAEGAPLMAMERGEVIQTGWHYLGGEQVYLRGAVTGDVYYYAHLSAYADGLQVGTRVVAGQVIGYVGATGNADVPHLHLGWMPEAGRVDLEALADPYPMLVDLCL